MPLTGRFRAVVFDMDGLLLDTEVVWHRGEETLFQRYGGRFTWEDKVAVIGQGFGFTARYFAERLGRPSDEGMALVDELVDLVHDELRREVAGRPGAIELVTRLRAHRGLGLGLASNSPRRLVDAALVTAGLTDAFDAIVTPEDVEHPKPAPDIYLEVCRRLGIEPGEALALEDSSSGIAAAKAAGLTCYAVPQFAEVDVSAADRVVDSLELLLD